MTTAAFRDSEIIDTTFVAERFRGGICGYIGLCDQTCSVRKHLSVSNNDTTCVRSIGDTGDLPRGRKRPEGENAKIKEGRTLNIWPVYRRFKRFQVIYLAPSDT